MNKRKLIRISNVPISLEILLGNQLNFMNQYYDVVGISSDKENLRKVADLQGVKVHHVEMKRKITLLYDLIALWKLYRYFKIEKPFIVHSHTSKAGTLGMIPAKLGGVPHRLNTVAGLPLLVAKGLKRKLLKYIDKKFIEQQNMFNYHSILKLVNNHVDGKTDNTFRVWTFFCFQKWYKNSYINS